MVSKKQEEDAKRELKKFLSDTVKFLKELVARRESYFPAELRPKVQEAWEEFEQDYRQANTTAKISAMTAETLQLHGLYGKQLDLKLSIISYIRGIFNRLKVVDEQKKKVLKWLLEAIDGLLDSLLEASGIKGAIKELKVALKNLLDVD